MFIVRKRPLMHYWALISNIVLASAFAVLSLNIGQFYLGIVLAILFVFEVVNFRHAFKPRFLAVLIAMIPFCSGLGSLLLCLKFSGIFDATTKMYVAVFNVIPPTLFATAFACGAILGVLEIYLTSKTKKKISLAFLKAIASITGCFVVFIVLLLPNMNINFATAYSSILLAIGSLVSFLLGVIIYYQRGKELEK